MRRHKVWNKILLLSETLIHFAELADKFLIHLVLRLAHQGEHLVRNMLRRDFKLAAHMMFAQLPEEFILPVRKQIVKPDAGADEDLFHSRDVPEFLQQGHIIAVVRIQILAGGREQALSVPADAVFHLFFTGRMAEVCRRSAHIMDIALEILFFCNCLCLFQQ